jgi:hypothetical protein
MMIRSQNNLREELRWNPLAAVGAAGPHGRRPASAAAVAGGGRAVQLRPGRSGEKSPGKRLRPPLPSHPDGGPRLPLPPPAARHSCGGAEAAESCWVKTPGLSLMLRSSCEMNSSPKEYAFKLFPKIISLSFLTSIMIDHSLIGIS